MIKVNIFEVKAKLSEYLDQVASGERVVICRRNRPVAELVRIDAARSAPRAIGGAKGQFALPPSFFEPLPADLIDSFYPGSSRPAQRVAAGRATYGAKRRRKS